MDDILSTTRRSLHGVAETLLAGPEHRAIGRIRLRVVDGGFSTLDLPGTPSRLEVIGTELVVRDADAVRRIPLQGTYGDIGRAAGIDAGAPDGVYPDGSGVSLDDSIQLDPVAVTTILGAFAVGDATLRQLAAIHAPDDADAQDPVLWPEHFDVGISIDEVNYGVSPGDAGIREPYAYVGPWKQRAGDFWDQPYGSARRLGELGDAEAVLAYFEAGLARAAQDPLA